jgi:sortase A
VNEGIADAFSEGWFSDPGANTQVALWGLILSVVSVAAYAISRRLRRDWGGLLIGLVPFTLALYFFFQNVNRLLPPNL